MPFIATIPTKNKKNNIYNRLKYFGARETYPGKASRAVTEYLCNKLRQESSQNCQGKDGLFFSVTP